MWYLKNASGANAYGSIEVSASPWVTQPWKQIKTKGSVLQDNLVVKAVDMEVCHWDRNIGTDRHGAVGEDRGRRLGVREAVRGLWLVLFSLSPPHSSQSQSLSENTLEHFTLLAAYTSGCADVLLQAVLGEHPAFAFWCSDRNMYCCWLHLSLYYDW